MKLPDDFILVCPECRRPCSEDHNSFWCNRCQRTWPKDRGFEQYQKRKEARQFGAE